MKMKQRFLSGIIFLMVICPFVHAGLDVHYTTQMQIDRETLEGIVYTESAIMDMVDQLQTMAVPVLYQIPGKEAVWSAGIVVVQSSPMGPDVAATIDSEGRLVVHLYLNDLGKQLWVSGMELSPTFNSKLLVSDPCGSSSRPIPYDMLAIPFTGEVPNTELVKMYTNGQDYLHINSGTEDQKEFEYFIIGISGGEKETQQFDKILETFHQDEVLGLSSFMFHRPLSPQ